MIHELLTGDSQVILPTMPENCIDSCVTDPPYGLSFMNKGWDKGVPSAEAWREVFRVLKPGAHLLAFFGTRTYHRGVCEIEDAGFQIRDQIGWAFGSGFPKSLNLDGDWEGWGTALKPAWEPIVVARKPLIGTVSENVQAHGTGALNIDGCRIGTSKRVPSTASKTPNNIYGAGMTSMTGGTESSGFDPDIGRWPANLIHDGSDEVLAAFPQAQGQQGAVGPQHGAKDSVTCYGDFGPRELFEPRDDVGSAARFFLTCNWSDEEWLEQLLIASGAKNLSDQSSVVVAFAAAHVASLALPEAMQLSVLKAPSITATPSESRRIATELIAAIQTIAVRCLRDWQRERLSPSDSPVSIVAIRERTGTITITASHSRLNGSAVDATFSITPKNLEAGEAASRFKYCAKASTEDREEGLQRLNARLVGMSGAAAAAAARGEHYDNGDGGVNQTKLRKNHHPTVKPTDLMRYLCRLVTPPGGTVLDPFMGSGSTGKAAKLEGFGFIGIELDPAYVAIAQARIDAVQHQTGLFSEVS